ncbi:MAG: DUF2103 domain-containing protein [Plectolyngbya sp. WJT66-NPBG17]|jgi:hypothetical protein|nr:DUF2103 domain-containing protein [Plectolyngbya sp. WJT66-NPBG17]MBW4527574.1 DUF2103 domain-containing protein [Phormidium tanganyikae FI6-MK23]
MKKEQGRLVLNHSTHLPGLIALLEKLIKIEGIQTITPAVIGSVRSHSPQFKLKISVPIRGGFKAIARQGKSFQEVFILTTLEQDQLESAIAQLLK